MIEPTHDHLPPSSFEMPMLDDEAVVQIQGFIYHFLDLFEARYGDQIHRFHEHRSKHNMLDPATPGAIDDPPF